MSSYTVHGDILVYPGDEEKMLAKGNNRKKENIPSSRNADKRNATAFDYRLWSEAILPYKMQRSTEVLSVISIYIYIYIHTHDYLNSRTKFKTLVWRLMKGLARN